MPRARLAVSGVAALAVIAGVTFVLLRGGPDDPAGPAADPECLAAWNADREALERGRHQLGFHGYTRARVLRVSEEGVPVEPGEDGLCAVAFAGTTLDSEPGAAARVLDEGYWRGLETLPAVTPDRLLEMQIDAQGAPNVRIDEDGRLVPL